LVKSLIYFEIIGEIEEIETMAIGGSIRDIMRLQKQFGRGRWRKLKLHWYEAYGVGKKKMKIKRFLD
jgi:hypothetical protein